MAKTRKKKLELENLGSIITIKGTDACLGYLMYFKDKGVFDATHGRVDVTPEQCKQHNEAYAKASLEGLDNGCEVGQGGFFYVCEEPKDAAKKVKTWDRLKVLTFVGTQVSEKICNLRGCGPATEIIFDRKGRRFIGIWDKKEGDAVFFRRVK